MVNCVQNPTFSPSQIPSTISPTTAPTPIQYCPPAYNPLEKGYVAGDKVEFSLGIYECARGRNETEVHKYQPYCNVAHALALADEEFEYWSSAW